MKTQEYLPLCYSDKYSRNINVNRTWHWLPVHEEDLSDHVDKVQEFAEKKEKKKLSSPASGHTTQYTLLIRLKGLFA